MSEKQKFPKLYNESYIFSDPEITSSYFLKDISNLEVDKDFQNLSLNTYAKPLEKNYRDPVNEYKLNSMGYRSEELALTPLVTAGCSITFGVGVPYSGIWSTLLATKLDLDHINLASPGWSSEAIVDNLFKYFYTYGNPKIVAVVLPDPHRVHIVSDRDYSAVKLNNFTPKDPPIKLMRSHLYTTATKNRPKLSKKPHDFLQFIPPEYGVYRAFKAINSLIVYCRSAGIDLVWSTWDFEMDALISAAKNDWNEEAYSDYVYSLADFGGVGCHSGVETLYGENFHRGYDGLLDKESSNKSHPGVHFHTHLFEAILDKLARTT